MLTNRPWGDVVGAGSASKRLRERDTAADREQIRAYAQQYLTHIVNVLEFVKQPLPTHSTASTLTDLSSGACRRLCSSFSRQTTVCATQSGSCTPAHTPISLHSNIASASC